MRPALRRRLQPSHEACKPALDADRGGRALGVNATEKAATTRPSSAPILPRNDSAEPAGAFWARGAAQRSGWPGLPGRKRKASPLPTGCVVSEMAVVVTRQERHFEPSMRRVLGANKKPKAESADRESPSRGIIAAPMADEPGEDEGDQPDATNPHKVMPHRRI